MGLHFQGCSTNVFDPLSPDSVKIPLISTAKSLTAEGDAFFASGDLESAKKSYEKALEKDSKYAPAIIGLVAVDLQLMVREEFPGKETFTAAVLPLLFDPMTNLASDDSGDSALAFSSIEDDPNVADIRSRPKLLSVVRKSLEKLFVIDNPSGGTIVNMTVLLSIHLLDSIFPLLEEVENMETISSELSDDGASFNSNLDSFADTDIDSLISYPNLDTVIVNGGGEVQVNIDQLQTEIFNLRNAYQKVYYVYYFFTQSVSSIETQLNDLDSILTTYIKKVNNSSNDGIVKDIADAIEEVQQQIADINSQVDESAQYEADFLDSLTDIKALELEIQSKVNAAAIESQITGANPALVGNISIRFISQDLDSADLTMCGGITVTDTDGLPETLVAEVGLTQLDSAPNSELNIQPVISNDPEEPCSGDNPRFEQ